MIRRALIAMALVFALFVAFAIGTLITVIQEWLRCAA